MDKLSHADTKQMLKLASQRLRDAAAEVAYAHEKRAEAETELATYKVEERIQKLATEMDRKGLSTTSFEDKVAQLRQDHNLARLDQLEEAVEIAAPQIDLGKVAEVDHNLVPAGGKFANQQEAEFVAKLAESLS